MALVVEIVFEVENVKVSAAGETPNDAEFGVTVINMGVGLDHKV